MQIPQILQQLGNSKTVNPMVQSAKNIMQMLRSGNPQMMLNQILQNNPQVNQIINQYGSVEGAITALCQQKGIDPKEFMDALK